MFEQLLIGALVRLHANNFTDSKQIVDQLSNVLLDETLDDSQVCKTNLLASLSQALCNSKIFNSEQSIFLFLESHAELKDNLTAQVRKGLFRMLAAYIKLRKLRVFEYIELIYKNCISLFKKEQSNQPKETSLQPIIKIIKYIDSKEALSMIIDPQTTVKILLDEIKFSKPTQKVQGSIWNLLGITFATFKEKFTDDMKIEVQTVCFKELFEQMKSTKPEISYIAGMFKSFRYSLKEVHLTNKEVGDLFKLIKLGIVPIKDIKQYSVITNSLRLLCEHARVFKASILEDARQVLDEILSLISHENREVKEHASDCLQSVMCLLADELDSSYKSHEDSFLYIIQKMYSFIQQQQQQAVVAPIIVIIRSIGIFSKAISKHLGQLQLSIFFKQMIHISEARLIRYIEKEGMNSLTQEFQSVEDETMKRGTSFKTILYRQKQVISFIVSFANIVSNLEVLEEEESQHLLRLSMIAIKQYSSFYEKYKVPLVSALVLLMRQMKRHSNIYILWLENLIVDGLSASIQLPQNAFLTMQEYYDSLKQCASLWHRLFNCEDWTDETLHHFAAKFFQNIMNLLHSSDLSYRVVYTSTVEPQQQNNQVAQPDSMDIEEQNAFKINEIIGDMQQVQYVANNETDLQFFYRVTLLFDGILQQVKPGLFVNYVYPLYKAIILKLRKWPRLIILLKLLKSLNEYIERNAVIKSLRPHIKKDIINQMRIFFTELYKSLGKYQDELLVDSLKTILSIPYEVIVLDNYQFFKKQLIIALKKGFELGVSDISMGFTAIDCLQKIIRRSKNRTVFKYLKLVIPYLSEYLQVTRSELESITSEFNVNRAKSNKDESQPREIFNLTLSELTQKKTDLVQRVMDLLGQLGGESHLIVYNEKGIGSNIESHLSHEFENLQISKSANKIISWDYEAKVIFGLPLLAKKVDINITKLLPRIVELTSNPEQKIKVYACEAIHAIIIYMIGQQASAIQGGQKKRGKEIENLIKSKEEYSKIYQKLFPVVFQIGSNSSHPSSALMSQLILQISRWFANSKQLDSPEVGELLDNIMTFISSKDNNNIRELAANALGQFIKWTLKQNSEQEIKLNHSNIKSTIRRIQSFAGQPDPSKRFGALLALKEVVNHTKNEIFLVDKFLMETVQTSIRIASKCASNTEVEDHFKILIKSQASVISKNHKILEKANEDRSGEFKQLNSLIEWLFDSGIFDKASLVRVSSYELWQAILESPNSKVSCRKFLLDKVANKRLFSHMVQLNLDVKQSTYIDSLSKLMAQIDIWIQIIQNKHLNSSELFKYEDFRVIFCYNVEKFFQSLLELSVQGKKADGALFEILMQENIVLSTREESFDLIIQVFLKVCELFELLSTDILELQTFLACLIDISQDEVFSLITQMLIKPNEILKNMNLDIFLTKSETYFSKLSKVFMSIVQISEDDYFETYVLSILEARFKEQGKELTLESIIKDESKLKESELRIFLEGMQIIFKICSQNNKSTQNYIEKTISGILQNVKQAEELLVNCPDALFRENRTSIIFKFALDISSESTNLFILSMINEQSQFFQKYENQLLTYVKDQWLIIGKQFLEVAKSNLSLLKLCVPLLQTITTSKSIREQSEHINIFTSNLPLLFIDRKNDAFLQIELKVNWLLVSSLPATYVLDKPYFNYIEALLHVSLSVDRPLIIHEQALTLLGFYLRREGIEDFYSKRGFKSTVESLRSKYFAIKVKEIKKDSKQEVDFKSILTSIIDMIKLAGHIELFEILFPVIREALPEPYQTRITQFISTFIKENFVAVSVERQISFMQWTLDQFKDKDLDRSLIECVRYEMVQKVLLYLIENAKEESTIAFIAKNAIDLEKILEQTDFIRQENMKEVIRWVQELTQVLNIFESMYKAVSSEKMKEEVHKSIYGGKSNGNELTKNIIRITYQYRKQGFERAESIREAQKNNADLIGIDCNGILLKFSCAVYNCLARVISQTQTKENVWNQFLFLVKNDALWTLIVDTNQKEFEFEIQTNFLDKSYARARSVLQRIPQLNTQQFLSKKYLNSTVLCSFNKATQSQAFLAPITGQSQQSSLYVDDDDDDDDTNAPAIFQQSKQQNPVTAVSNFLEQPASTLLEMDSINKHQCMGTLMELIDRMTELFPGQDGVMPPWMSNLYEEIKKESCSLAVRIFIIKIVLNKSSVFEKYSTQWFDVLVDYARLKDNGSKFFHYFLRDVCTTLIDWCSKKPSLVSKRITSEKKQNLCAVINKICRVLAHKERDIFRQNVLILRSLMEYWHECIFVEEAQLNRMLMLEEKDDAESALLWNLNAMVIIDACIHYRVPILQNYEAYARAQVNDEKYAFFVTLHTSPRLKRLLFFSHHSKKQFCKAASGIFGRLLSFMKEQGGQFEEKRKMYESEIVRNTISIQQKTDKTSKERFPVIIASISQHYPDLLNSVQIMIQCQDYVQSKMKQDRAYILSALYTFIAQKFERREDIKSQIHSICLCFRGNVENIINDESFENQERFLSLLVFLTNQQILNSFTDAVELMVMNLSKLKSKYERHAEERYATAYYTIVFNLYDYIASEKDAADQAQISEQFKYQVKSCILSGLTSQHINIRQKTFEFLDQETNESKTPYERLLFLIQEIYQPEQEKLWLLSAVPLIMCLSKRTSDYSKNLFDEQLSKYAQFYDWDFRDTLNMRLYNSSQPLTPVVNLSQSMIPSTFDAQGFAIPAPRKNFNATNLRMTQIPQQDGVRATVPSQAATGQMDVMSFNPNEERRQMYKEQVNRINNAASQSQSSQEQSSQSQRNPFLFSFGTQQKSLGRMPEIGEEDGEDFEGNLGENSQGSNGIDIFSADVQISNKNANMSKFFASNLFNFSSVNSNAQKRLRFQDVKDGQMITKSEEIRKRQHQAFIQNQSRARKAALSTIRKYKIGELPDISIQYKDIIDPLMALSFVDETLAGQMFQLLVHAMFMQEQSDDRQKRLKDILSNLLRKSQVFDFNFVSTIHKTMMVLCKEGEIFDSDLIKVTGMKSHSYYTTILLLEENLFTLFYRLDDNDNNANIDASELEKRKKKIKRNLNKKQLNLIGMGENEDLDEAEAEEQKRRKSELERNEIMTERKKIEVNYWMDLIDIYSHLNEKDQIKGILKKAVSKSNQKDTIHALDLKLSGQISHAEKILKEIIKSYADNQQQQIPPAVAGSAVQQMQNNMQAQQNIFDSRIQQYIQSEYEDSLALLGKWDDLANELLHTNEKVMTKPEYLGIDNMKLIMLSLMQSDGSENGRWEELKKYVKGWMDSEYGKQVLEGPLSYEMSLITIIDGDIDRTRYYHKLSQDEFLRVWSNFGNFATASKHEYLSNIYRNYELKEYLNLDGKIEATLDDFTTLFRNWQARQPSNAFDSQICWDQILNSREIFSLALYTKYNLQEEVVNRIRSNWYVQNVKGMLKKGIYGAADRKMKKATRFRRVQDGLPEFNWEFYKITSKLKLKQLEVDLKGLQSQVEKPEEKFNKLIAMFEKEKNKHIRELTDIDLTKFDFLKIQVQEKFIDVYNDYSLTQSVGKDFLENYATVINSIYEDYFVLFQKDIMKKDIENKASQLSIGFGASFGEMAGQQQNAAGGIVMGSFGGSFNPNLAGGAAGQAQGGYYVVQSEQKIEELVELRRKCFLRFANFSEQLLRMIETESREELKTSLKQDYGLTVEKVGVAFLENTLKCFALMGGMSQPNRQQDDGQMEIEQNENSGSAQPAAAAGSSSSSSHSLEFDQSFSNLILKMLRIIQKIPNATGKMFQEAIESKTIPTWVFISFLPQMMHVIKRANLVGIFSPLISRLATHFPEALIYQFNTIFSAKHVCETDLSQSIFDMLHAKLPVYYTFMKQLNNLTHPEHRLIYHLENLKNTFIHFQKLSRTTEASKSNKLKEEMQRGLKIVVDEIQFDVFDVGAGKKDMGSYNTKFAKDHIASFNRIKKDFSKIATASDADRKVAYENIKKFKDSINSKDLKTGYDKLSSFSHYLSEFQGEDDIEVPGQYSHGSVITEPNKDSHIRIASFDAQILTLSSIRRPKRLTVYGTDEKAYKFLVKGIEDLRLDQRIEQLFTVMNNIFSGDPSCESKELNLATFNIIPMTNILGVLEWVDKTQVLKDILNKEYQEKKGPGEDIWKENEAIRMRKEWIAQFDRKGGLAEQHIALQTVDHNQIVQNFNAQANMIPVDLMRNALERLASTAEAYLYLKERFIRNYAVVCTAGYILGIGDRHLENFLVNYQNGDIISIDFGYSFGAGLGLGIPELMPFRLTRCFTNLMNPVGIDGIFRQSMVSSMAALKKKRNILLEFCEVFINDPLVDWVKLTKDKKMGTFLFSENIEHLNSAKSYQLEQSLAREQIDKNSSSTIDASIMDNMIIHIQRIDIVKLKLIGMNPSQITTQELSSTRHKTERYYDHLVEAVKGKKDSLRVNYHTKQFLDVHEQVDCLIDISIDPNIIGRVWIGWSPIV